MFRVRWRCRLELLEADYHGGNAPRYSSWLRDSVPGSIQKRSDDRFWICLMQLTKPTMIANTYPAECAHRTASITIVSAKTTMITIGATTTKPKPNSMIVVGSKIPATVCISLRSRDGMSFPKRGRWMSCQGSEGFYWPSTTLLGWHAEGWCRVREHFQRMGNISTAEELATNPQTKLLYCLVSGGQSSSQKTIPVQSPLPLTYLTGGTYE